MACEIRCDVVSSQISGLIVMETMAEVLNMLASHLGSLHKKSKIFLNNPLMTKYHQNTLIYYLYKLPRGLFGNFTNIARSS